MKNQHLEKNSFLTNLYIFFSYFSDILAKEGLRADMLPIQSDLKRSSCNNNIWVYNLPFKK
tara:strand:+ start:890 stop:1072 length:183 start_codon:yes stop_codon:yes gene_type:complete